MFRSVDLSFLCEEIDSHFNDYILDGVNVIDCFYYLSYDGGPNHEIHKMIVIILDHENKETPYKIDCYHKEYMWNNSPFITFEQEQCDLIKSKTLTKLKEMQQYLDKYYYIKFILDEV